MQMIELMVLFIILLFLLCFIIVLTKTVITKSSKIPNQKFHHSNLVLSRDNQFSHLLDPTITSSFLLQSSLNLISIFSILQWYHSNYHFLPTITIFYYQTLSYHSPMLNFNLPTHLFSSTIPNYHQLHPHMLPIILRSYLQN